MNLSILGTDSGDRWPPETSSARGGTLLLEKYEWFTSSIAREPRTLRRVPIQRGMPYGERGEGIARCVQVTTFLLGTHGNCPPEKRLVSFRARERNLHPFELRCSGERILMRTVQATATVAGNGEGKRHERSEPDRLFL